MPNDLPTGITDKPPVFGADIPPLFKIFIHNNICRKVIFKNLTQHFNNGLNSAGFFHLLSSFMPDYCFPYSVFSAFFKL
jgi:hypothetical protein